MDFNGIPIFESPHIPLTDSKGLAVRWVRLVRDRRSKIFIHPNRMRELPDVLAVFNDAIEESVTEEVSTKQVYIQRHGDLLLCLDPDKLQRAVAVLESLGREILINDPPMPTHLPKLTDAGEQRYDELRIESRFRCYGIGSLDNPFTIVGDV